MQKEASVYSYAIWDFHENSHSPGTRAALLNFHYLNFSVYREKSSNFSLTLLEILTISRFFLIFDKIIEIFSFKTLPQFDSPLINPAFLNARNFKGKLISFISLFLYFFLQSIGVHSSLLAGWGEGKDGGGIQGNHPYPIPSPCANVCEV